MGERLVDLTSASIGAVIVGTPTTAGYDAKAPPIRTGSDYMIGNARVDRGPWDITCNVAGEDPLSIPLVGALAGVSNVVAASGRLMGTATLRQFSVAHAVLIGMRLSMQDLKSATVQYDFRNRAAPGATKAQELSTGAGVAAVKSARKRLIKFAAGSTFTPDGGEAIPIPGVMQLDWQAQGQQSDADADTGSLCIDQVDVRDWLCNGSLRLKDQSIESAQSIADYLADQGMGTLAIALMVEGSTVAAEPPPNKIMTIPGVVFVGSSGERGSGKLANDALQFEQDREQADGSVLTMAQVLTFADAA